MGAAGTISFPTIANNSKANKEKFGIILSSLKEEVKANPEEVFRQLAEAGYKYIESIGRYDIPAGHTMPYIKKYGLVPITTGDSMAALLKNTTYYFDIASKYDLPYIVCYYPWMDSAENLTREQCLETAGNLNKIAKIAQENERKFAWHNHHKEFWPLANGTLPFDIVMENTDKELVNLELDIFWVKQAGHDPLTLMKKYGDRIKILHLKDMLPGEEKKNTAPGKGIIDFRSILKMKIETATEYSIVEFAGSDLTLNDALESIRYLEKIS
jgi:sugar phosphate isomerase/epimerase